MCSRLLEAELSLNHGDLSLTSFQRVHELRMVLSLC